MPEIHSLLPSEFQEAVRVETAKFLNSLVAIHELVKLYGDNSRYMGILRHDEIRAVNNAMAALKMCNDQEAK